MSLEKKVFVDKIEIVENGSVHVRTKTAVFENGVCLSSSFHRHIILPGNDYTNEDTKVQAICKAIHTAEVVEAYKTSQIAV